MGVGWRLTVDSFMSQFNSGLLLALPGVLLPWVSCMENSNCTPKWLLGLLFRPTVNFNCPPTLGSL
jgi:hypothetical protein